MRKDFKYSINQGLPGGANELKKFVKGSISVTGYKSDSPDVNNDFNIIPSNRITMQGVNFPVLGVDDLGYEQMMMPGGEYNFPGNYVTEIPQMGKGGLTQWFAEKWTDVKTGKPCGRSGKEKGSRPYPACRPSKRVNETTPKTTSELSSAEKAKFKREKTSGKRISYNHKRREYGGETGWLDQYQDGGLFPVGPYDEMMAPKQGNYLQPDINRPYYIDDFGGMRSEYKMGFNLDGKETLIPTVVNGRQLTEDQAINNYFKTGLHMGKYNSVDDAEYASKMRTAKYNMLQDPVRFQMQNGGWLDNYQEGGHIIQPDETFYGIANKYGIPNQDLILANPDLNIDKIRPGQRIHIPESFKQSEFPVGYFETSDKETFNRKSKVYPAPKKEEPVKKELPKEEPLKISRELNDELFLRQAFAESTFNPKAKSSAGYMGLAQIGNDVIKDYKKATGVKQVDPYDPAQNMQVQKWAMNQIYNSEFVNKEGQDPSVRLAKTLASYNWGKGNVLKHLKKQKAKGVDIYNSLGWVESLPKETRDYVHKIQLDDVPEFKKGFNKAIKDKQYKQYIDLYKKKNGGQTNWLDNYK